MQQNRLSVKDVSPYLTIAFLIFLFCYPILFSLDKMNLDDDWVSVYTHHFFLRHALLTHYQIALWSPYLCGGYPIAGYPEYPVSSPLLIFPLLFGEIIGTKIYILFFYLSQGFGVFLFSKHILKYSTEASLYTSSIVTFSSWLPWSTKDGNMIEMYYVLFPLLLFFIQKRIVHRTVNIIIFAFFLSLVIYDGNVVYLSMVLFLFLFTVLFMVTMPDGRVRVDLSQLGILCAGIGLSIMLCLGRVIPMANLLLFNDRGIDDYYTAGSSGYTIYKILTAFLFQGIPPDENLFSFSRLYIGLLPLLMSAGYLCVYKGRAMRWCLLLMIAVFLAMSYNAPIDIYRWLWKLPLYHSMNNPAKHYDYYILFIIGIMAGGFLHWLGNKSNRNMRLFISLIVWFGFSLVFFNNMSTHRNLFVHTKPAVTKGFFYHVQGVALPRYDERPDNANYYFNVLKNIGTIDWKANIFFGEAAIPKYFVYADNTMIPNAEYKGEVYFVGNENTVTNVDFTPNKITVSVDARKEERLVINQNYHKNWYVAGYDIENYKGLLSISRIGPGQQVLTLIYREPGFVIGSLFSLGLSVTLLGFIIIYRSSRTNVLSRIRADR